MNYAEVIEYVKKMTAENGRPSNYPFRSRYEHTMRVYELTSAQKTDIISMYNYLLSNFRAAGELAVPCTCDPLSQG